MKLDVTWHRGVTYENHEGESSMTVFCCHLFEDGRRIIGNVDCMHSTSQQSNEGEPESGRRGRRRRRHRIKSCGRQSSTESSSQRVGSRRQGKQPGPDVGTGYEHRAAASRQGHQIERQRPATKSSTLTNSRPPRAAVTLAFSH
jgi:hypothetical protein